MPVGIPGVEERKQVGMLEIRRDPDLAQEALDAQHGAELRFEHLDRDGAVVLDVAGEEDGRHAAATNLPLDQVRGAECVLKLREEIGHGGGRRWEGR